MDDPRAAAVMAQLSQKRALAATIVPTADADVRRALQALHEPQTLFGEGPPERRDRLKALKLANADEDEDVEMSDAETPADEQEEFYTEGSPMLRAAREELARYSLRRSRHKLAHLKAQSSIPLKGHVLHRNRIKDTLRGFENAGSQTAGRPVSSVRFSPDGNILAAADWGGAVTLYTTPALSTLATLKGHRERVRGLSWLPGATRTLSPDVANLVSGGAEGDIQFWGLPSADREADALHAPLHTHSTPSAVRKLSIHPSARYMASAHADTTWSLYSLLPTGPSALMTAEGHSRECTTLSFSPSGDLLLSAGADAYGRIWDLRSGRTVMLLAGHTREIHGGDWAPGGAHAVTAAADGLGMVWDVRAVRDLARVPLHSRGVTDVRWFSGTDGPSAYADACAAAEAEGGDGPAVPTFTSSAELEGGAPPPVAGTFLVSGGFDKNVALTSAGDWTPVRALSGHSGHVLSVDVVHDDARYLASGGYDRTVKIWARDDGRGISNEA